MSERLGWPQFIFEDGPVGDKELQEYFNKAFTKFKAQLDDLEKNKPLDEAEEKKLRFMLEALLAARYLLNTKDK